MFNKLKLFKVKKDMYATYYNFTYNKEDYILIKRYIIIPNESYYEYWLEKKNYGLIYFLIGSYEEVKICHLEDIIISYIEDKNNWI